jgi:hypothetical protein
MLADRSGEEAVRAGAGSAAAAQGEPRPRVRSGRGPSATPDSRSDSCRCSNPPSGPSCTGASCAVGPFSLDDPIVTARNWLSEASVAAAGVVSAGCLFLAFVPPARFRAWLRRRADAAARPVT